MLDPGSVYPMDPMKPNAPARVLRGSCHCRSIGVVFATSVDPRTLLLRACQCSFCRRHGARTTSDPKGHARILVRDPAALTRYRFGTRTAEFLLCGRCGAYAGPFMESEGRTFAACNVNVLDEQDAFERDATPMHYEAETAEERAARRRARWTPADIVICRRTRADSPDASALIAAYFAELAALLGGFDPEKSVSANSDELSPPQGVFILMSEGDRPLACGGLKTHSPGIGEIKRMFPVPGARGRSLGRDLLRELENAARDLGMHRVVLDTAAPLDRATALYQSSGYVEVPPFNANPYAARWFAKDLD